MKEITEAALTHVLLCHPNAKVEERGGEKFVKIPVYDILTDLTSWEERRVKPDADWQKTKFQPGDELRHTKTGAAFSIVDPFARFLKLRRGPKSED